MLGDRQEYTTGGDEKGGKESGPCAVLYRGERWLLRQRPRAARAARAHAASGTDFRLRDSIRV